MHIKELYNNYAMPYSSILEDIAILIPAFNPDKKLVALVHELINNGAKNIIIIDDGSEKQYKYIFENIKAFTECVIIEHAVNLGKGRALKTGFNYFLIHFEEHIGLITVDADGQHKCEDILKVAQELKKSRNSLILGCRNFNTGKIPLKNKLGNLITAKMFSFFSGINVSDTQTGLRGILYQHLLSIIKISGERYEFEMNMLLDCREKRFNIKEILIDTIYLENNKSSHFNPFIDSIKIYMVFFKFISSSISSFFVDILSFIILVKMFSTLLPCYFVLLATIGSRIISSVFNYIINYKTVFCVNDAMRASMIKYYNLAIIQMLLSALGVSLIYNQFHQGEVFIKMLVDSLLFLGSFRVQRDWVFKLKKTGE